MLSRGVARRYAQALFELASEAKLLDRFEAELTELAEGISANPEVIEFLNNPRVPATNKKEFMRQVFSKNYAAQLQNFIDLVVDRQRQSYLLDIIKEYRDLADAARNIVEAHVKSAIALSEQQQQKLLAKLAKSTGKSIRLVTKVDPSLIGGVVVKIGDRVVDGSVVGRLAKLKETLVQH